MVPQGGRRLLVGIGVNVGREERARLGDVGREPGVRVAVELGGHIGAVQVHDVPHAGPERLRPVDGVVHRQEGRGRQVVQVSDHDGPVPPRLDGRPRIDAVVPPDRGGRKVAVELLIGLPHGDLVQWLAVLLADRLENSRSRHRIDELRHGIRVGGVDGRRGGITRSSNRFMVLGDVQIRHDNGPPYWDNDFSPLSAYVAG